MNNLSFKDAVKFSVQTTSIGLVEDDDLHNSISTAIIWSKRALNFNIHDDDVTYLILNIIPIIKADYKDLKSEEILIAFKYGSFGRWGKFIGFSIATFIGFINSYKEDPERLEILKSKANDNRPKAIAPHVNSEYEVGVRLFKEAFAIYKKDGHYNDIGCVVFDFIYQEKIISIEHQRLIDALQKACDDLYSYYKSIKPRDLFEKREIEKKIKEIEEGKSVEVFNNGNKVLLNDLFNDMLSMGVEPEDLLTTI